MEYVISSYKPAHKGCPIVPVTQYCIVNGFTDAQDTMIDIAVDEVRNLSKNPKADGTLSSTAPLAERSSGFHLIWLHDTPAEEVEMKEVVEEKEEEKKEDEEKKEEEEEEEKKEEEEEKKEEEEKEEEEDDDDDEETLEEEEESDSTYDSDDDSDFGFSPNSYLALYEVTKEKDGLVFSGKRTERLVMVYVVSGLLAGSYEEPLFAEDDFSEDYIPEPEPEAAHPKSD
jgi:hypothetical protein